MQPEEGECQKGGWWRYRDEDKNSCISSDQVARIKPTEDESVDIDRVFREWTSAALEAR